MTLKSLQATQNPLSKTERQLEILSNGIFATGSLPTFVDKIKETNQFPLRPSKIEILQINVGYMCNQVCAHCHVDAGPDRKEIMTIETMKQILEVLKSTKVTTLDLTGGAPEMNPHFRWFVEELSQMGKKILNRCNLTIILANEKYRDLPQFFAKHGVKVVSSLPYYQRNFTEATSAYHRRSSGHRFGNECMPRSHSPYIAWDNSLERAHPPACRSHEGGRVLGISALCSNQHRTYFLVFLAGQEQLHSDQQCGEGWR